MQHKILFLSNDYQRHVHITNIINCELSICKCHLISFSKKLYNKYARLVLFHFIYNIIYDY